MRILGRKTSINVRKVLWAADELGLSYQREDWGLPLRDPHVPEFLALNPNAQVPVLLEDDGFALWESGAILLHFAEGDGAGILLPPEPQGRAQAYQWLFWQGTELNPAWGYAVYALIRRAPGFDDPERIAHAMQRWAEKMAILEAHLSAGRDYVAAQRFTLADIVLGLSIHRWLAIPRAKPAMPACEAYYERLRARPAAAPWLMAETP